MKIVEPPDAEYRLKELGMAEAECFEVVMEACASFNECTPNHPVTMAGMSSWGNGVRKLRDIKVPQGWRRIDDNGVAMAVHPTLGIGVTVCSGYGVGRSDRTPTNKNAKGPATLRQIRVNRQYLLFEANEALRLVPPPDSEAVATWLLMIELVPSADDSVPGIAWVEFSLPAEIDEHGFISAWHERIILGAITFDGDRQRRRDDDGSMDDDIDIPVSMR